VQQEQLLQVVVEEVEQLLLEQEQLQMGQLLAWRHLVQAGS